MNVGARFAVCDCAPARPAHTTSAEQRDADQAAQDLDDPRDADRPRARSAFSSRGDGHRTASATNEMTSTAVGGPAEDPARDRQVLAADDAVGERVGSPRTSARHGDDGSRVSRADFELASSSPVPWSSISKIPSAFALKRVRAEPPAGTLHVPVVAVDVDLRRGVGGEPQAHGLAAVVLQRPRLARRGPAVADADRLDARRRRLLLRLRLGRASCAVRRGRRLGAAGARRGLGDLGRSGSSSLGAAREEEAPDEHDDGDDEDRDALSRVHRPSRVENDEGRACRPPFAR